MANFNEAITGGTIVKIWPITTAGDSSKLPTYGTMISIDDAFVSLELTPEVSESDFYASNKIYFSSKQTTKVTGTLSLAALPDEFYKNVYKFKEGTQGELVEELGKEPAECALGVEFTTNNAAGEGGVRVQLYRVKFSKPSISAESASADSTVQPLTLTFTAFARAKDDRYLVKMANPGASGSTAKKQQYGKFLTAVVEPTFT